VRSRRVFAAIALFSAVALLTGACAQEDDDAGQQPQAAECSAERLQAFGGKVSKDFKLASFARKAPRVVAQAKKTVKIGFFGDLTGANSQLVVHPRNAAIMAAEQANEEGDLPVRIEVEQFDNKDGAPGPAPALAQRAIGDSAIVGVVGPGFSGETESTGELFERAGLAHITQSATRIDLTQRGWKTFFRGLANDTFQGNAAGDLLVKVLGCREVALIDDKTAYGAGLAEAMIKRIEDNGGEIVLREGIEPTTDYTAVVDSLLSRRPEVIYYAGYSPEASLLVKQYQEKGGEALFTTGDGSRDATFLKNGRPANEGTVLTCPCVDPTQTDDPALKEFAAEYEERFDEPVGVYGAEGWDATQIFIAAIKDAGADVTRQSVLEYVTNLNDYKGLTKTFNWTDTRDVTGELFIFTVEDGKYVLEGNIEDLVERAGG
jgi:branched-chain amino acid transport system substrate-binding protein